MRSPDGVLHLAWHHPTGPNTEDLLHTVIARSGRLGATNPIQSGWTGFQNAALVLDPQGLRVFFGAIRSTDSSDPQDELNAALSSDGGASWALQPWAGSLGTWVHSGLTPATPNHDFQAPLGTYGYYPNLATDASARTILAWYSSATGHLGVLAQDVAADGSPIGSPVTMPGTSDMAIGILGRTPLVARSGGGLYVAYPTGYPRMNRVRVWRVGSGAATQIARLGNGNHPVALAAAPDGRLWVVWAESRGGAARVLARRSNEKATRFGAVVDAGRPAGAPAAYQLDASPVGNALDVLANFNIGTQPRSATYYRRIKPGLTLTARPSRLRRGVRQGVDFTVTDAGDPVRGARVAAGGASATSRDGSVTLRLAGRAVTARATKAGYTSATRHLRVR